jgi:4-hydroxy-tetrahydrodipicolinate reductase
MKVAVSGAAGRMGKRILSLAHENPDIQISGALETKGNPLIGMDAGELAGIGRINVLISDDLETILKNCDVLIDFSSQEAGIVHARAAAETGKSLVIGTTGFSEAQKKQIADSAVKTRIVLAPNMSRGVNLLFKITELVAKTLGDDYDIEIIESHHNKKKDAPSGTAEKLAQTAASALGRDLAQVGVFGRQGLIGERNKSEIGVFAVRAGDIVGEHTVMFVTGGERIELIHRAHSRDAFASGAIQAALWLRDKPNGLYDMQDVLGLKELS